MNKITTYAPDSDLIVTETTYGTGNTVWAYKGNDDEVYTYHLYAKVRNVAFELPETGGPGEVWSRWMFIALTAGGVASLYYAFKKRLSEKLG